MEDKNTEWYCCFFNFIEDSEESDPILIAAAIFATDFVTMTFMSLLFRINLSTFALIILNASILVLVISPILLVPKKKIEKEREKSEKLNRLLKAMIGVNQLITKESDIKSMVLNSCKRLREVRDYYRVFIASFDGERLKRIAECGVSSFMNFDCETPCVQEAVRNREILFFNSSVPKCKECKYGNFPHSTALISFSSSGDMMLLAVFAAPNHFDDEKIELLKEVADDIGFAIEKCRMEETVYRSEKRYRFLAENVSDVIWVMNKNLNFKYISPSIQKLLGYSVEEITSIPLERYMAPESFELLKNTYRGAMEELEHGKKISEISKTLELQFYHKNGNKVWIEVKLNVIYTRDSYQILGVTRDISERKRAEGEIRKFKAIAIMLIMVL
ncbi:MAG TPA: PAS domain S-box protein [Archaeoglobaceae archaeon]|nr:PAS domain S-box protein [Archaeoglobaceae archaeon]